MGGRNRHQIRLEEKKDLDQVRTGSVDDIINLSSYDFHISEERRPRGKKS